MGIVICLPLICREARPRKAEKKKEGKHAHTENLLELQDIHPQCPLLGVGTVSSLTCLRSGGSKMLRSRGDWCHPGPHDSPAPSRRHGDLRFMDGKLRRRDTR